MRILSQDNGKYDLPYENIVLEKTMDCNTIYAYTGTGQPFKMAVYSSAEKMDKVMDMLHTKYSSSRLVKDKYCKLEELTKVKHDFGDFSEVVAESNYFRFPQDSEIEV